MAVLSPFGDNGAPTCTEAFVYNRQISNTEFNSLLDQFFSIGEKFISLGGSLSSLVLTSCQARCRASKLKPLEAVTGTTGRRENWDAMGLGHQCPTPSQS